jgi:hypothetical protein
MKFRPFEGVSAGGPVIRAVAEIVVSPIQVRVSATTVPVKRALIANLGISPCPGQASVFHSVWAGARSGRSAGARRVVQLARAHVPGGRSTTSPSTINHTPRSCVIVPAGVGDGAVPDDRNQATPNVPAADPLAVVAPLRCMQAAARGERGHFVEELENWATVGPPRVLASAASSGCSSGHRRWSTTTAQANGPLASIVSS